MKTTKILNCLMLLFLSLAVVSCGSDDDEPDNSAAMRGYWVCDQSELALEIISSREYYEMRGESFEGVNTSENVYQLWSIKSSTPEIWVKWSSDVGYMLFHDPDYTWKDKVRILLISEDKMSVEGWSIYQFRRVSKSEFNSIVKRM